MTLMQPASRGFDAINLAGTDADSFAAAVQPYTSRMIRLAARLAPRCGPDDIVQEALIRAWRHRERFDPERGSIASWLMAIVANEARRAGSRLRLPMAVRMPMQRASVDDRIDVEAAVAQLSPRQKLAIDCFYYADLSVLETAAVMGCSESTVKTTLADARARLRIGLGEPR